MNKRLLCMMIPVVMSAAFCGCGAVPAGNDNETAAASAAPAVTEQAAETDASVQEPAEDHGSYTIEADLTKGASPDFYPSDGWSNGNMFDCTWKKANCTFDEGVMKLTIDSMGEGYSAAEYRTNDFCGYGRYEVTMKPIKNTGVVSSFFTYTGPSDNNPWDEIDIEFLGKDTTVVQFNYFTDGKGNHEKLYDLGFDASEDFHTYGFEWLEGSIKWYVDGEEVHSADTDIPSTPGRIMMNVWNGKGVDSWLGAYDGTVPLSAEYSRVTFTEAE